jgi:site-specific DNA-methyltransferase (adenine-specific)
MNNIKFFNEDCFETMNKMQQFNRKVDLILTSPPYNTAKKRGTWSKEQKTHYDLPQIDSMTDMEYIHWSIDLFNNYDKVLKENGVILYNISYSTDKPYLMYEVVAKIMENTKFRVADTVIWKKKSALPNNMSHNRMTRICEMVFVFCREEELKTFHMNKEVLSVRPNGIKQYTTYYNFVEAKNNDGSNKLNKATFSSDLAIQLLSMYAKENNTIYDSFMGTGTTAIACEELGLNCFGSELSKDQVEFSINRLNEFRNKNRTTS